MRQSQCDRHKVKMMDVFGPHLTVVVASCWEEAFFEAAVRIALQKALIVSI
jgi:hypothetical protein